VENQSKFISKLQIKD